MLRGPDSLKRLLQSLNDFRMLRVEIIRFSEILFQIVELRRGIAGFGFRPGLLVAEFAVAAISLTINELPFSGTDGESARPTARQNNGALRV